MAAEPWLSQHAAACRLAQELAERIRERERRQRGGESPAQLNVFIRSSLQNLKEKIDQLRDLLLRDVSMHQITQMEGDRRQNLVDELVTRQKQLEASYRNEGPEPDMTRSSLMTGGIKRGVTNPWLLEEPEETRGLGFHDIRQQQRRIIEEQDAGLDALSSIISRQKQMGQEIGNELDEQNGKNKSHRDLFLCKNVSFNLVFIQWHCFFTHKVTRQYCKGFCNNDSCRFYAFINCLFCLTCA
ncbi:syntaxin-8 isoform X1 [Cygnus olor]|uniref:syntaxin-8 isoform X1 n=1 Tax=Cygnus atratus TaxID=8868 RepID=UPI0015D5ED24|nr:syntaxin-8 isoform X1 [Cygnus atratus]XP_040433689.1 syntaxin-8 isoform X1 [Cygnus olor]